ncbi:uncharacterized protein LOC142099135 isoform X2 [Mixophyes fleayi]|uniref:uncharacterized protein LOC142099135 isoform X2 n=1 Tax=Mixophyes fleayi TaxID=3061075 RepID=UPI003F4E37DE
MQLVSFIPSAELAICTMKLIIFLVFLCVAIFWAYGNNPPPDRSTSPPGNGSCIMSAIQETPDMFKALIDLACRFRTGESEKIEKFHEKVFNEMKIIMNNLTCGLDTEQLTNEIAHLTESAGHLVNFIFGDHTLFIPMQLPQQLQRLCWYEFWGTHNFFLRKVFFNTAKVCAADHRLPIILVMPMFIFTPLLLLKYL